MQVHGASKFLVSGLTIILDTTDVKFCIAVRCRWIQIAFRLLHTIHHHNYSSPLQHADVHSNMHRDNS